MKVPVKGETDCKLCSGTGHALIEDVFFHPHVPCPECKGKGKIPTLTYKEISPEDQVTEQINQWYNGR